MAKQILVGIEEQNLNEVAHYLVIYFPYNEEMCSYTDDWLGELYENKYPLVSKGMWSGIIDLKVHKLLDWKPEYGTLYLQAKVCDSGTYFLLDKDKKVICKITDYVPNGLIPEADDCGDYIRLRIKRPLNIRQFIESCQKSFFRSFPDCHFIIVPDDKHRPLFDTSRFRFRPDWKLCNPALFPCQTETVPRTLFT